jgi:hypothetical protein
MAKVYRITFTQSGSERVGEKDKREAEISILQQLFELAANTAKKFKDANLCLDLAAQMENLTTEQSVTFTKEDLKFLEAGWVFSEGSRPNGWWLCKELLKQLESPKEEDVE